MDNSELEIVFICKVCNFLSPSQDALTAHMSSHNFTSTFSEVSSVSAAYVEKSLGRSDVPASDNSSPFNTQQPPKITDKETKLWTEANTLLLIELCKNHDKDFETGVKKYIWQKICNKITEKAGIIVTAQQCDTKWRGLKAMYKQIKKHNDMSGKEYKHWEYFDTIDELLHKKPEINPSATCSARKGLLVASGTNLVNDQVAVDSSSTQDTTYESSFIKKRKCIESPVAKRHKEKMQRQDRYLEILDRMVSVFEKAEKKENYH